MLSFNLSRPRDRWLQYYMHQDVMYCTVPHSYCISAQALQYWQYLDCRKIVEAFDLNLSEMTLGFKSIPVGSGCGSGKGAEAATCLFGACFRFGHQANMRNSPADIGLDIASSREGMRTKKGLFFFFH